MSIALILVSFASGALLAREVLHYRSLQARLREDRAVADLESIYDREWE